MTTDNISTLFTPNPDDPAGTEIRQGIVQSWNSDTGENQVQFGGGTLANVPSLTSEAVNLVAGDVVALAVSGDRVLLLGKVTTPGDPGTVPSWPTDITALDTSVTTLNTVTIPAVQADVTTAQTTADAAQADASTALGKFPITETDISDDAITSPKIAANAVEAVHIAADAIDGKTITGALIRTAATGQRVEIDSPTATNRIQFFTTDTLGDPGHVSVGGDGTNGFVEIAAPGVDPSPECTILMGSVPGSSYMTLTTMEAVIDADTSFDLDTPVARINGSNIMVEGGNPQPAAVSDATSLTNLALTTTYAPGSPVASAVFTAPSTGKVYISVGGRIQCQTASNTIYLGYEVRTGAVVGSGTVVQAANAGQAVAAGGNATGLTFVRVGGSHRSLLTGLTPGNSYNIRTMHACQSTTATGDIFNRSLLIEPVL